MKIIGVGFGRSGTLSLRAAIERLGAGPCLHMLDIINGEHRLRDLSPWVAAARGEQVDWRSALARWEATVDWPGCTVWRELVEAFPEATVLLNVRGFEGFYRSCQNTLHAVRQAAHAGLLPADADRVPPRETWEVIERFVWQGDFGGRFEDKEWVRRMYEDRIAEIKATVPADRLVVWTLGVDGWEPLAEALGVPVPAEPFPHLHDTDDFRRACGLPPLSESVPLTATTASP
ncbi:sulfotransferase family protein [Micromonospora sp. NPDC126480]|uniref:sulfotransferase family protein n=1 Tax=Micromonospora sp. NPDC126480 TaxID=3155312 RepID=UPI00332AC818